MTAYHLYTANRLIPVDPYVQRSIHVMFVLTLVFLSNPLRNKYLQVIDYLLVALGIWATAYVFINYPTMRLQAGLPDSGLQIFLSVTLGLLIMEACRRTIGLSLPILSLIFVLYALYGRHFPAGWSHPGFSLERIAGRMFLTIDGFWGMPTAVSATIIIMFIIFGAFLRAVGIERIFNRFALLIAGRTAGGPAQVAVVSSALLGTVTGSAVANVATTGSFTIPMMKERGYKNEFAAAVEAVASTGGQIMPPIMGAGAFIMAEMLRVPYSSIVVAATLPALLYFANVFLGVHFEALRLGMRGGKTITTDKVKTMLWQDGYLLIPLVVVVYFIIEGFSPVRAALYGTYAVVLISFFKKKTWFTFGKLINTLKEGSIGVLGVAAACSCSGIVLGVMTMTGLGVKFSRIIVEISGGNIGVALVMAMTANIILGMSLPTAVAYIIAAVAVAPGLISMGLEPIIAHMFIFYFSIFGTIVPPVCLAVYTASSIADASWSRTAFISMKLALPGFLIPYMMVQNHGLILRGTTGEVVYIVLTALLGIFLMAGGVIGYLLKPSTLVERGLFIIAGLSLLYPGYLTDILGVLVAVGIFANQKYVTAKVRGKESSSPAKK